MKTLGSFHVKTHLSQVLKEVEEGGEIIGVTKHGRIIAVISPALSEEPVALAALSIRKNRRGVRLGKKLSLKALMAEGRR
jgi:prevent-host-death family protein